MNKSILFVIIFTLLVRANTHAQIQIGQDIDGEAAEDFSGNSVSMPDANTIAIGALYNDGNGNAAGHVRIYSLNGNTWVQKGIDIDGEAAVDYSGYSVSMPDPNTVAIGAYLNDGNGFESGHVRIYSWSGSAWVQKGIDIDGEGAGEESGWSVSMPDANTVAIGAKKNEGIGISSIGHVRIYSWSGSAWVQKGIDLDGEAADDESGSSVSMPDANTVAIGAYYNDGNGLDAGHVRIYSWTGSAWVQKGIDIDGEAADDLSGSSVSMPDANTVAIGAPRNSDNGFIAGHVRIYSWSGSAWVQKGIDIDGEVGSDESGWTVSMPDANTVAIGAKMNEGIGIISIGHVRIYKWSGSAWLQKGIDIDGEEWEEYFGTSVSMPDANTLATGAIGTTNNGLSSGSARVYKLKGVFGLVYNDLNQNCTKEESGVVLGAKAFIKSSNTVVETGKAGNWAVDSLPAGNYTITYDTSGNWSSNCSNPINFTVTDPSGITIVPSYGMVNSNPCAEPNISVTMPFMRPGFSNQNIYVRACNEATATGVLTSAYAILEINPLLFPQTSSLVYTSLGNNQYRFELGNINPGECTLFSVACSLSVSAVLNQTLCMKAELFPQPACVFDSITPAPIPPDFTPCALPWDKSSIKVEGACANDSIYFTVTNTGQLGGGDMDCFAPVRLYIDGEYISLDSIKLVGGATKTLAYDGDGKTWRLEVDQHPLHPGFSKPNASLERCGNLTNWTPNLTNILPMDDADPIVDVFCEIVSGSYDPNDKRGFPLGTNTSHYVSPNGMMDYMIRFQNTGTDTAFTVVVRDTLDTDLDIFSVRSGASSHNYKFRMYGPRVLEWTFEHILLPDSNTNEPASNGFITFTVDQNKNLPDLTPINNSAGIYFDYNAPIITNTASHVVHRNIYKISTSIKEPKSSLNNLSQVNIYPNPTNGSFVIYFGADGNADIQVTDITGRIVYTEIGISGEQATISLDEPTGIYFVKVNVSSGSKILKLLKR